MRKDVKFAVRQSVALGNNGLMFISDVHTVGKKMGAVVVTGRGIVQEVDRNEANGRIWNIESVTEDELSTIAFQCDGTHPNGMNGQAIKTLDGVWGNQ